MGLIEVAEITPGIHRVLIFRPKRRRVAEGDFRIFFGKIQHERIEITKRGCNNQLGAIKGDHRHDGARFHCRRGHFLFA